jgi:hypothetical protein
MLDLPSAEGVCDDRGMENWIVSTARDLLHTANHLMSFVLILALFSLYGIQRELYEIRKLLNCQHDDYNAVTNAHDVIEMRQHEY